jgi:hypothetical protein
MCPRVAVMDKYAGWSAPIAEIDAGHCGAVKERRSYLQRANTTVRRELRFKADHDGQRA